MVSFDSQRFDSKVKILVIRSCADCLSISFMLPDTRNELRRVVVTYTRVKSAPCTMFVTLLLLYRFGFADMVDACRVLSLILHRATQFETFTYCLVRHWRWMMRKNCCWSSRSCWMNWRSWTTSSSRSRCRRCLVAVSAPSPAPSSV